MKSLFPSDEKRLTCCLSSGTPDDFQARPARIMAWLYVLRLHVLCRTSAGLSDFISLWVPGETREEKGEREA